MPINGGVIVSSDGIDEKYRFGLRDSCDKHKQHHNAPESTLIFHICVTPDSFTYCLRDWTRDTEKRLRSSPYSSIKRLGSVSSYNRTKISTSHSHCIKFNKRQWAELFTQSAEPFVKHSKRACLRAPSKASLKHMTRQEVFPWFEQIRQIEHQCWRR